MFGACPLDRVHGVTDGSICAAAANQVSGAAIDPPYPLGSNGSPVSASTKLSSDDDPGVGSSSSHLMSKSPCEAVEGLLSGTGGAGVTVRLGGSRGVEGLLSGTGGAGVTVRLGGKGGGSTVTQSSSSPCPSG